MRRLVFSLVAIVASVASAHETWLIPTTFSAKVDEELRFDVSSGMAFPRLESPIRAERVDGARFRIGTDAAAVTSLKTLKTSLELRHAFKSAGVATVWLDLKPKEIALTDPQVAEYLDEIGATEELRTTWAARKGRLPWKETYTKHAKSFVAVGDINDDRSWATGTGSPLELVPMSSPFEAKAGGELTIELQAGGKPVPGLPVGLLVEGSKQRVFRTTNADGRARFPIARAGRALLFAVRLVPSADGSSWNSDFCTMTFAIHRP